MWETAHMVGWAAELSGGSAASYLRHHAYDCATWFFGTDFGWAIG